MILVENQTTIIYINSVSLSICDGGFGGGGRERPVKQWAKNRAGSVCNRPLPPPPPTPGPVGLNVEPRHKQTGCIMHRVHTSRYNFLQINFSRIIVFVHYGTLHMYLSESILIQGHGPLFATHIYFPIGYLHIFFNLIIEYTCSNLFTNIM